MTSSNKRVLNLTASSGSNSARRPPGALALELQKSMLQLKGQYMSEDGREVHYNQLRDSQLFAEYKKVAKLLCDCELGHLQEENEKKAFFISILKQHYLILFSFVPNHNSHCNRYLQCSHCSWSHHSLSPPIFCAGTGSVLGSYCIQYQRSHLLLG